MSGSGCLACVDSTDPASTGTRRSGNLAKVNDQNAGFNPRRPAPRREISQGAAHSPAAGSRALLLAWDTPLVSGRSVARKRDAAQALEFRRWLSRRARSIYPIRCTSTAQSTRCASKSPAPRAAPAQSAPRRQVRRRQRTLAAARAAAKAPDGRWTETPPEAAKPRRRSRRRRCRHERSAKDNAQWERAYRQKRDNLIHGASRPR